MAIEKENRAWTSSNVYDEFVKLRKNILKISLAVENYADATGDDLAMKHIVWKKLLEFRNDKDSFTERELLATGKDIWKLFCDLIEQIGKDKFIFYDDGNIEYNWGKKK